ncbi:MAG: hypothetical protein M1829_005794 [Trizodia sp. TS-e1964]|nr:MAG: hypothetical protein M1829_005794 [Trizodia sp. TS-e1964]
MVLRPAKAFEDRGVQKPTSPLPVAGNLASRTLSASLAGERAEPVVMQRNRNSAFDLDDLHDAITPSYAAGERTSGAERAEESWSHTESKDLSRLPTLLRAGHSRLNLEPPNPERHHQQSTSLPSSLQAGLSDASSRNSQDRLRPSSMGSQTGTLRAETAKEAMLDESHGSHSEAHSLDPPWDNSFANKDSSAFWGGVAGNQPQPGGGGPAAALTVKTSSTVDGPISGLVEPYDHSNLHPVYMESPIEQVGLAESPELERPAPHGRVSTTSISSEVTVRSNSSAGWDPGMDISTFDAHTSRNHGLSDIEEVDQSQHIPRTWEEQKIWEKEAREKRQIEAGLAAERAQKKEIERRVEEEWRIGEEEALKEAERAHDLTSQPFLHDRGPPGLPPRLSKKAGSVRKASRSPARSTIGAPADNDGKNKPQKNNFPPKSETYQIKHIKWSQALPIKEVRRSAILVQNANGPCPLLALVNALTLSTPSGVQSPLTETLRLREQISLGLLLEAVIEELMSDRRQKTRVLPDVSDLYSFLVNLHTGMNVNPRFLPSASMLQSSTNEPDIAALDRHQPHQVLEQLGGFEETREMRLYSTFSIPLVHGWLPPKGTSAYEALQRSANTYEEAQNLLFREEELEGKLRSDGLSPQEQRLFEDIHLIKTFLTQSATQLTSRGIEVMVNSLAPGSIAVLFRNDHFSTLYVHPQSRQLLTLVTDVGYAAHDEVIWESLVGVNGEGCEFFAGDFRPVGNVPGDIRATSKHPRRGHNNLDFLNEADARTASDESSRKAIEASFSQSSRGPLGAKPSEDGPGLIQDPNSGGLALNSLSGEQEDHDLALALQLQEEEEDRHRREVAQRRLEEQASLSYLSQEESARNGGLGRTSSRDGAQGASSLVSQRGASSLGATVGAGAASTLPPYEQSAIRDFESSRQNNLGNTEGSGRNRQHGSRGNNTYSSNAASRPAVRDSRASTRLDSGRNLHREPPLSGARKRQSADTSTAAENIQSDKGKDCVVM